MIYAQFDDQSRGLSIPDTNEIKGTYTKWHCANNASVLWLRGLVRCRNDDRPRRIPHLPYCSMTPSYPTVVRQRASPLDGEARSDTIEAENDTPQQKILGIIYGKLAASNCGGGGGRPTCNPISAPPPTPEIRSIISKIN